MNAFKAFVLSRGRSFGAGKLLALVPTVSKGTARERNEWCGPAGAPAVNRLGEHAFACAALTHEQNWNIRLSHSPRCIDRPRHHSVSRLKVRRGIVRRFFAVHR